MTTTPTATTDAILQAALDQIAAAGVPLEVIIDRLATYAGYLMVTHGGKDFAAGQLRQMADTVQAGLFDAKVPN